MKDVFIFFNYCPNLYLMYKKRFKTLLNCILKQKAWRYEKKIINLHSTEIIKGDFENATI